MTTQSPSFWLRLGLLALPAYGLLTFWGTLTHQPDPGADFGAYARYVSATGYLVNHLLASILGTVLGILGAGALGVYLAGRHGAVLGTVCSVAGHAFILTIFGFSTFASPAIGRAYLAGQRDVVALNQDILGAPLLATALAGGLLYAAGTALFGVAVWRSGALPRWAGALYAPTGFLISLAGLAVGAAQTAGTVLLVAASAGIARAALRGPAPEMVEAEPQPGAR